MNVKKLCTLYATIFFSIAVVSAFAKDPYLASNNSWINLSGTVVNAGVDTFELDYGKGLVIVEMDDWDWYPEAHSIMEGDEVIVTGRVDDDLYELTTIEASSVYVKGLNTYFYASSIDEEDVPLLTTYVYLANEMALRGQVTKVNGREFTIETGTRDMIVDTDEMAYNPMDDKGFQKIKVGDQVQVIGTMDKDLFERNELKARLIITLQKDKTRKNKD